MQRRRGLEGRLRDDHGLRCPGGERFDRSDNPQGGDLPSDKDGGPEGVAEGDDPYASFRGEGIHVPPFGSEIPPPPVLMPVPGAG